MKHLFASLLLLGATITLSAQKPARSQQFNLQKNVAIQGYDPVAYFTEHKAIKGKKEFAVNAEGVLYYLSSVANKDLFIRNYKNYEPQYGGWCAYAMGANGEKVEVDPKTFKILDNKLYLFYNSFFNNTLIKWNKDEASLRSNADKNWQTILNKPQ